MPNFQTREFLNNDSSLERGLVGDSVDVGMGGGRCSIGGSGD